MSTQNHISRRQFLKNAGTSAVAITVAGAAASQAAPVAASGPVSDDAWGVLIDLTRCTGCNSCALACKDANNCPDPDVVPMRLDSGSYSYVDERDVAVAMYQRQPQFVKRQCMHCLHPACASACTVGALRKTPEGPVVYDSKKCIGCRYCQYACPFGIPTYDWNNPLGLIHKCQMCIGRLAEGEMPACVAACPAGVLRFGQRNELLAQARGQIQTNPTRYIDHIYGEHEAGGTSMLYLSSFPFVKLGFPELGPEPISRYAEPVMKATPIVAATVASVATGLYWLMKRRDMLKAEVAVAPQDGGAHHDN